jgi:hypothetical protein
MQTSLASISCSGDLAATGELFPNAMVTRNGKRCPHRVWTRRVSPRNFVRRGEPMGRDLWTAVPAGRDVAWNGLLAGLQVSSHDGFSPTFVNQKSIAV